MLTVDGTIESTYSAPETAKPSIALACFDSNGADIVAGLYGDLSGDMPVPRMNPIAEKFEKLDKKTKKSSELLSNSNIDLVAQSLLLKMSRACIFDCLSIIMYFRSIAMAGVRSIARRWGRSDRATQSSCC